MCVMTECPSGAHSAGTDPATRGAGETSVWPILTNLSPAFRSCPVPPPPPPPALVLCQFSSTGTHDTKIAFRPSFLSLKARLLLLDHYSMYSKSQTCVSLVYSMDKNKWGESEVVGLEVKGRLGPMFLVLSFLIFAQSHQ